MSLSVDITHRRGDFALEAAFDTPGGVTALVGRSGAGKTTLVDAVAGLLRPDRGRITLGGRVLVDVAARIHLPARQRLVGYVFQDSRLFPHLDVAGNLDYARRFAGRGRGRGGDAAARRARVIEMLGLGDLLDRAPGSLSGGQARRVAIGRALLAAPDLLLMDEPLTGLDEARREEILPYLMRLRDEAGLPILYVSHALGEVARLASHVVALEAGRVVAAGGVNDVLADTGALRAAGMRSAAAVVEAELRGHTGDGLSEVAFDGGTLLLPRLDAAPGARLRIRIDAQDVMLATARPEGLSALNILPVTVTALERVEGAGVLVRLAAGSGGRGAALLARITERSATALALAPGLACHAIVKTVSLDQP